jgi:hypothetical protein
MAVPRPVDQGIKGQLRITVSSTAPTIRIAVASHVIGFAAPEPSDSWPDAWSGHEGLPQDRRPAGAEAGAGGSRLAGRAGTPGTVLHPGGYANGESDTHPARDREPPAASATHRTQPPGEVANGGRPPAAAAGQDRAQAAQRRCDEARRGGMRGGRGVRCRGRYARKKGFLGLAGDIGRRDAGP